MVRTVFVFRPICYFEERALKKVAIIMGSASDKEVASIAVETLKGLSVPYTVRVLSAHRTPDEATAFAKSLEENDYAVAITIAGKAAHLGGVIAANTTLPVIGIPVKGSDLGGMDALLSIVQMPPGIPVASMAINGAKNAAIFAAEIIAINDDSLKERIKRERKAMRESVLKADREVEGL